VKAAFWCNFKLAGCEINGHETLKEVLHGQSFADRAHHLVDLLVLFLGSSFLAQLLQPFNAHHTAEDLFLRLRIELCNLGVKQGNLHLHVLFYSLKSHARIAPLDGKQLLVCSFKRQVDILLLNLRSDILVVQKLDLLIVLKVITMVGMPLHVSPGIADLDSFIVCH